MTVEIGIITGLISCLIAILTFFAGRQSSALKAGVAEGELKADIKYIKEDIEEIKQAVKKYDENNSILTGLQKDIIEMQKSLARAHSRIDSMSGINGMKGDRKIK